MLYKRHVPMRIVKNANSNNILETIYRGILKTLILLPFYDTNPLLTLYHSLG